MFILTARWRCVFEELMKLTEVHDHTERVALFQRTHLLAGHYRTNTKFLLRHIQTQLTTELCLALLQRRKITARNKESHIQKNLKAVKQSAYIFRARTSFRCWKYYLKAHYYNSTFRQQGVQCAKHLLFFLHHF